MNGELALNMKNVTSTHRRAKGKVEHKHTMLASDDAVEGNVSHPHVTSMMDDTEDGSDIDRPLSFMEVLTYTCSET